MIQLVLDPVSIALLGIITSMLYIFGHKLWDHEIRIIKLEGKRNGK